MFKLRHLLHRGAPGLAALAIAAAALADDKATDPAPGAEAEGPTVETSLVAVGQRAGSGATESGRRATRFNVRGDVVATVPFGDVGGASLSAVGHLRFGQGEGLVLRPTHTGTVNSTAFTPNAGADNRYAILAQAYLQMAWPLGGGPSGDRLEVTAGKMDLFGFFDGNAAAADESAQFLNNVLVHNPLLDSGGDIAADEYGFAPGLRLAWTSARPGWAYGASVGVFGAGKGATFDASPGRPLVIAQVEISPMEAEGEPTGTWRAYAWTNGQTAGLDGARQRHAGFGVSLDHRVGGDAVVFARLGKRTRGDGAFDDALAAGVEWAGRAWGRAQDAVGFGVASLKTSRAWRDATADRTLAGFAASGREQTAELYYRFQPHEHFALTPDLQIVRRPGGDAAAPTLKVFGLRATIGF